jgi:hypothetical protein
MDRGMADLFLPFTTGIATSALWRARHYRNMFRSDVKKGLYSFVAR